MKIADCFFTSLTFFTREHYMSLLFSRVLTVLPSCTNEDSHGPPPQPTSPAAAMYSGIAEGAGRAQEMVDTQREV